MNDLDAMSKMASGNMDIRMSNTVVAADKVSQGGVITMGVDLSTFMDIVKPSLDGTEPKYHVALYVINIEQFNKIRQENETKETTGDTQH